jgi:hypothetical protein
MISEEKCNILVGVDKRINAFCKTGLIPEGPG